MKIKKPNTTGKWLDKKGTKQLLILVGLLFLEW